MYKAISYGASGAILIAQGASVWAIGLCLILITLGDHLQYR
jgi:hypothetical protein